MVSALSQRYRALPAAGAVMDQPVWVLQMQAILRVAESEVETSAELELADLQEAFV